VIKGDHTVVAIFLDLTYLIIPVAFLILGVFVAFVQAFVFTLLSMVYVALATEHDH
jgi:F-type H+-transporting ATPase subunit a